MPPEYRAMADRLPSDHDSISTDRATLVRRGGTSRPAVELPADSSVEYPSDEVVRVVIDGDERHARVTDSASGLRIPGVYDDPSFARDPGSAPNRLVEWIEAAALELGGSVLVDEIEPGFKYGLRAPGERVVYEATESPDDSLASIAKQVEQNR